MMRTLVVAEKNNQIEGWLAAPSEEIDWVKSLNEARLLLRDPAYRVGRAIFDPKLVSPLGLPLMLQVIKASPLCSFYSLTSHEALTDKTAKELKVNFLNTSTKAAPDSPASAEKKNILSTDDDFIPVPILEIFGGVKLNFDLFVRVGKEHFVRILPKGAVFQEVAIDIYAKRGIRELYIAKAQVSEYSLTLNRYARILQSRKETDWSQCINLIALQGDLVLKSMGIFGLNEKQLLLAKDFLSNVEDVAIKLNKQSKGALAVLWENLEFYDHAVGTVLVAATFIDSMGFTHERSIKNVGLACLLHDFSLFHESSNVKTENLSLMTDAEKVKFNSHPIESAKMLAKLGGLDPVIMQAVEQHHELRTRKGFPNKLGAGQIHPVAEIIGISDEFVHLVREDPNCSKQKLADIMSKRVYQGFSSAVVTAFDETIFRKK